MPKSVTTFLCLIFFALNVQGQQLIPRNNFYSVSIYNKKSTVVGTNKMLFAGNQTEVKTNMETFSTIEIKSPVGDSQSVDYTINKISGSMTTNNQKTEIPNVNAESKMHLNMKVNSKGELVNFSGSQELIQQLQQNFIGTIIMNKPLNYFLNIKSPKNEGNQWTDTLLSGGNTIIMTYHLNKFENNTALISISSELIVQCETNLNGIHFTNDLVGKASGNIAVDTKTNYIINTNAHLTLEGRIIMGGREIPSNIELNTTEETLNK